MVTGIVGQVGSVRRWLLESWGRWDLLGDGYWTSGAGGIC